MSQRDVFAIEPLDVAHEFGLGVVQLEYFVGEVVALSLKVALNDTFLGDVGCFGTVLSGGDGKNGKEQVDGIEVGGFVYADTYIAVVEVMEVNFFTEGDGANLLGSHVAR
ncbi:hypothetical protein EVA_09365 [gut metagenome]|uniref:Uncharacterized protein n=1 Tax=gut metagenome TaxID=749906 RepID=J9GR10_9ZZZZ